MDSASIAPVFQQEGSGNFFRDAKMLRDTLRERLSAAYRLQEFALFLVPSVTHGLLALVQLLAARGRHVALARGSHYAPVEQLFGALGHGGERPVDALITTHVCPYTGAVWSPSREASPIELVDASHSFATNLHRELVGGAKVFVAPLHKHAALATGLALIAVRQDVAATQPYDLLALVEQSTASQAPLIQALRRLDESGPLRFNRAAIGAVHAPQVGAAPVRVSDARLALPFACFRHELFARLGKATLQEAGATYFPQSDTLRVAAWARGSSTDAPVDLAPRVQAALQHLFLNS